MQKIHKLHAFNLLDTASWLQHTSNTFGSLLDPFCTENKLSVAKLSVGKLEDICFGVFGYVKQLRHTSRFL
jgi:hypothetical protein